MNEINEILNQLTAEEKEKLKAKKVLITGGGGFLGSWIGETLLALDTKVYCVDNFSTGIRRNIESLKGNKNFYLIEKDVENFDTDETFDFIFHFASRPAPDDYVLHPIETLKANSIGTLKMLELSKRSNSTFIYASSSEVYGDAEVIPTPEDYWGRVNPIGVRSCYDEGKRFSEALCMAYFRECNLDVRIVRIFNTFGPRLRADGTYGRAISRFLTQALGHQPITIYGDGQQTRSFTYVTDTITGILKVATSSLARGEVFNIGNTEEIRIIDLARLIIELTKSESKIIFLPPAKDDPRRRRPDITKAMLTLKWAPRVSIEEGIKRTIEWLKSQKV